MIILDGNSLDLNSFIRVARHKEEVSICTESIQLVNRASEFVESIVESELPVYGINTGFGKLSDVSINKCDVSELQKNLLMSHACGVGAIFSEEIVRGMMVLRINALIKGYSGIRIETLNKLVELLNKGVSPVVFEKGSLGASGDLAPLSHMSLPIIGLGEVIYNGERLNTMDAFKRIGIEPIKKLKAKEGLSLINGTQAMTSVGAIAVYDAYRLYKLSNISLSMTIEATNAIIDAFNPKIHLVSWLDGKLAILLNQRSVFGARLDSWADAALYAGLAFGTLVMYEQTLRAELPWIFFALTTYLVSTLAGFWKYRRWPSYHTRAAKTSWFLTAVAVIALFLESMVWPLRVALFAVILTNLEALAITAISPRWQADVTSIYHVWRDTREQE